MDPVSSENQIECFGSDRGLATGSLAIGRELQGSEFRLGLGPTRPYQVHYTAPTDTLVVSLGYREGFLSFDDAPTRSFTTLPGEAWYNPAGGKTFVDAPGNNADFVYVSMERATTEKISNLCASTFSCGDRQVVSRSQIMLQTAMELRQLMLNEQASLPLPDDFGYLVFSRFLQVYRGPYAVERLPTAGLSPTQLRRTLEYIEDEIDTQLSICVLAQLSGMTSSQFFRAFKVTIGMSPHQYVIERRVVRGMALLERGEHRLADVAYAIGFSSQSHMTTVFRRRIGKTPAEYHRLVCASCRMPDGTDPPN